MVAGTSLHDASSQAPDDASALRAELQQARRELRTIMDLVPSSLRVIDLTGRIRSANADAISTYGQPVPLTLRDLWTREAAWRPGNEGLLPFLETPGMRALAGETVRHELLMVRRDGEDDPRMLEVSAAPLTDDAGRVVGAVLIDRDVTDSRLLDRSLDREVLRSADLESRVIAEAGRIEQIVEARTKALASREDARARDRRLAAIGQLAAGVMHDVNNALNPIMAAAYLLRHHAESPDAVRDYADRIRMAAETGAATASRVGRFIRQEPMHGGADEVLDLSALAEEVLQLTEPMQRPRRGQDSAVHLVRELDTDVQTRGIPGEIREALLNLVSNAMDAMPEGGTLTVRTSVAGRTARVSVEDTGQGMTDEVRERAFEPFFTTKGAGGSGLGLAEVYGIARRHRGAVTISSALGRGTRVTMSFPLERVLRGDGAEGAPDDAAPLHILIVEDHEDGREFLQRLLRADGHDVDAAVTCAEARARLTAAEASSYDLMLTDVGLTDGSGWDLVAFCRERFPDVRVGVITGWEPMVSSAEALGAEFVLRKPLRAAELLFHIAGRRAPDTTG